jgi:hypothetical protein
MLSRSRSLEDEEAVKKNIRQRKNLELKNNPRR